MSDHAKPHAQLHEYSVVFSDRACNHMSGTFQETMRDLSNLLADTYGAQAVVVVPGGGTFAMEAVARQFARDARCLVVRNGWFSYRWSQIIERAGLSDDVDVLQAQPQSAAPEAAWAPPPIDDVVSAIAQRQPEVVFAPHVETSAGIVLPDDYLRAIADAVHAHGGLFVLDCVASGTIWVDMARIGIDVLISAPQKGWSATPSAGLVMLSDAALQRLAETQSDSFACDLKQWLNIMRAYEAGGHAYHATLPTDGLVQLRDAVQETRAFGLDASRDALHALGSDIRKLLNEYGYASVAAEGFAAPSVIVCHTRDDAIHSGAAFATQGLQIAKGVPLMCGEPEGFKTFRIGLFGLDKLYHPDRTTETFRNALAGIAEKADASKG